MMDLTAEIFDDSILRASIALRAAHEPVSPATVAEYVARRLEPLIAQRAEQLFSVKPS